jgi:hypothetical protein
MANLLPKVYESKEQFDALRAQLVPMKQRLQSQQAGLQVHMLRDPSGRIVPGQATASGELRPSAMTAGYSYVGPTQVLDTKTDLLIQPKTGGPPLQTIPKNIREEGFQHKLGESQGTEAGERPKRQREAQGLLASLDQKHTRVNDWIDQAITLAEAGWGATGLIGGLSKAVPGTPAFELNKTLGSIRSNLGLDELQHLRLAGTSLGQVTEAEHRLLQDQMGILEQGLPKEKFIEQLQGLKRQMETNRARRFDAYERDFRAEVPAAGTPGQSGRFPDKSMSEAQIRELAQRRGISEDEVRKRAQASGYRIVP